MFLLSKRSKIGKIFQCGEIDIILKSHPNILIICTFKKIQHHNSVICCSSLELLNTLLDIIKSPRDFLIYSVSTLCITNKKISYFNILNCKGVDIYIQSFSEHKLWYVDVMYD